MSNFRWLLAMSTLIVVSCAPVIRVNTFDSQSRSPNFGKIEVYSNPQAVPFLYKEIGLITVDDEGWERSESELLDQAIEKAKQMGSEGIIILSQDKQLDGYVPIGNIPVAINRRIVRVSAIVKTGEKKTENSSIRSMIIESGSVADEIAKLKKLMDEGVLTEEEFQQQKMKLLSK